MTIRLTRRIRAVILLAAITMSIPLAMRLRADTGTCGGQMITSPFNDVSSSNIFFCAIAEAYFSGLTNGTTPTTYSPSVSVPREQMAAFITRTQDSALRRGSRRAALNQWWTPRGLGPGMETLISGDVTDVVSDGADLWTMAPGPARVDRVRASDGVSLTPVSNIPGVTAVVASGRIYVAGGSTLSFIEKGSSTTISSNFSANLTCIAYDGADVWTGTDGGVIGKTSNFDGSVTTANSGFGALKGMLFDGANVWVIESFASGGQLYRLDSTGSTTQVIATGIDPRRPIFDGTNIWVPNFGSNTVTVVRASSGAVLATLSGNGLNGPTAAAFDGERILVINTSGKSVSLWKGADLTPLGSVSFPSFSPAGVCSDGVNFWICGNSVGGLGFSFLVRF